MPTYEYQPVEEGSGCEACAAGFDVLQGMSEEPLTECPECGATIARVITGCRVNTRPTDAKVTSDDNLKRLGFQKFVKDEGGYTQTV